MHLLGGGHRGDQGQRGVHPCTCNGRVYIDQNSDRLSSQLYWHAIIRCSDHTHARSPYGDGVLTPTRPHSNSFLPHPTLTRSNPTLGTLTRSNPTPVADPTLTRSNPNAGLDRSVPHAHIHSTLTRAYMRDGPVPHLNAITLPPHRSSCQKKARRRQGND